MKVKFFFAWYDFWIGFFYDQYKETLYICPLPCCVIKIYKHYETVKGEPKEPKALWDNGKWYHVTPYKNDEHSQTGHL